MGWEDGGFFCVGELVVRWRWRWRWRWVGLRGGGEGLVGGKGVEGLMDWGGWEVVAGGHGGGGTVRKGGGVERGVLVRLSVRRIQ